MSTMASLTLSSRITSVQVLAAIIVRTFWVDPPPAMQLSYTTKHLALALAHSRQACLHKNFVGVTCIYDCTALNVVHMQCPGDGKRLNSERMGPLTIIYDSSTQMFSPSASWCQAPEGMPSLTRAAVKNSDSISQRIGHEFWPLRAVITSEASSLNGGRFP